ncbi:MAG: TerB family tellurite resistance protein [Gemmatimonadales bacterium]|nr:TerB family tellurite resistance protein [Gemmatimonadales bacterium]
MLDALNRFFQEKVTPAADVDEDARRLRIATCVLLLEVAHADDEFSEEEKNSIAGILGQRFNLGDHQADELVALAERERLKSDSLFEFAQLLNEKFTRERKLAIVQLLWRVVYEDGILEAHEDALMHKVGKLLGVRHEELMALKIQVKRSLAD